MTSAAIPAREYREPAGPRLSASWVRVVLILLLVAAFYSASWKLAHVDPGKLMTGLPKMASWAKNHGSQWLRQRLE